ncbi:MAG TPA: PBP1A family penicillin-binding protein [Pyrinomonadaceae bacterium]|nr:PBP1A family penicillin-binding protein [Pyrinomonadaceae bacterium]
MAAEIILTQTREGKTRYVPIVHPKPKQKTLVRRGVACCKVGGIVISAVLITVGVLTYNSYRSFAAQIDQQIAGGYLRSHAGLYAAPRVIEKGARLTKDQLATALQRAGYASNKASNIWNGSFQMNEQKIRILPRQGTETHQWIDVNFDKRGYISSLSANDQTELASYAIEPELLTVDAALKTGQQETLTYQNIPPVLVQAILAIEDRRFFEHNGVDVWGVGRAFLRWSTSGSLKFRQGGSTITQQLVKNTYLTPAKTLKRKFNEAMIAVALEQRLSKQDIFALYCNEVYLGQRNGVGVRGVAQAARVFFGKELKDISLAEAATIAGMIQGPARYAPDRHPEAARARRDLVIAAMARDGMVDVEASQREQTQPVSVAEFEGSTNELAPYYLDAVSRAMDRVPNEEESDVEQAIRVETTIDPDLQSAAEKSLRNQLELLNKSGKGKVQPQGAMVALDPHTGQVLAMVGGRSYEESQLNRATDAKRQPGSVFKPFVYAAAFESGISPLSTYNDAPQTFQYGNATYSPANYGKAYSMHDVLLREALVRSLNVVTVDLAMRTGLSRVARTAERFGLPKPDAYPSMALGTSEVTPLQMAAAYATFANGGSFIEPTVIAKLVDNSNGEMIGNQLSPSEKVIKSGTAYMITDILSDVIKRGTARRANAAFKNVAIAGKTGTSRDGWFVGYTPNLVCAVWIGFDDNQQLGLTGAEAALPAWMEFMEEALAIRPSLGGSSFAKPGGIVSVKIDPETGDLAGPHCPSSQTVSVAAHFAPRAECFKHLPVIESQYEIADWESPVEPDTSIQDLATSEVKPSEEVSSKPLPTPDDARVYMDDEVQISERRQMTQTEFSPSGRPLLVNAPVIPTDALPAKSVGKRRQP